MVVAYTSINVVWVLVWHFFVRRLTGYSLLHLLMDTVPFALAAFGVMALCYVATMSITNDWLLLAARIPMAVVLYFAVMKMARVKILDECLQFAKRKVKH